MTTRDSAPDDSARGDSARGDDRKTALKDATARLAKRVARYRRWARTFQGRAASASWEALYPHWPALTTDFCRLLDAGAANDVFAGDVTGDEPIRTDWARNDWARNDWARNAGRRRIELLLYALARDDEDQVLQRELIDRPGHLIALAPYAARATDYQARWQVADALARIDAPLAQLADLLEPFLRDPDEYVSRRALISLTALRADDLDAWATRAWKTGDPYQRLVALEAFAAGPSPLPSSYLDQAEADGREFLVQAAARIRAARADDRP